MFDLHTHSLLSDGALLPSEVAMRYLALGYQVIAITDHADYSNIEQIVSSILKFTRNWPKQAKIKVLPGVELTHLPLEQFKPLVQYARKKGIKIIIGHGETLAEPVIKGTNMAALLSGIDILAHPGLITAREAELAKKKGVFLEITSRRGHRDTNAQVAESALKSGARLILGNDSHQPQDIIGPDKLIQIARNCGLNVKQVNNILEDTGRFLSKKEAG